MNVLAQMTDEVFRLQALWGIREMNNRIRDYVIGQLGVESKSGQDIYCRLKTVRLVHNLVQFYRHMRYLEHDGYVVGSWVDLEIDGVPCRERRYQITEAGIKQAKKAMNVLTEHTDEVFRLTNIERGKRGITLLERDTELERAAQQHSIWMADNRRLKHSRHTPGGWDAENVAAGQDTAEEVMRSWMTSTGHRRNILDPSMKRIGIGMALGRQYSWWSWWWSSRNIRYWTQQFKRR